MTTKELINQYVTAHADNRWMDASELEALLTEFAEKLKEPASEDLEDAASSFAREDSKGIKNPANFYYTVADKARIFKAGSQWQREQMMKGAFEAVVKTLGGSDRSVFIPRDKYAFGDKVKVIIIKE